MHTRKSAPLPSPSSAQNPYEINYAEHYPRLHQYIMDKIEQQKKARILMIKQFEQTVAKLAQLSRLKEKTAYVNKGQGPNATKNRILKSESFADDYNFQEQISQQQQEQEELTSLQILIERKYEQICLKQLQIKKLFMQAQGILSQLYELIQSNHEQFNTLRSKQINNQSRSCKLAFLSHQSIHDQGLVQNTSHSLTKSFEVKSYDSIEENNRKQETNNQLKVKNASKNIKQQDGDQIINEVIQNITQAKDKQIRVSNMGSVQTFKQKEQLKLCPLLPLQTGVKQTNMNLLTHIQEESKIIESCFHEITYSVNINKQAQAIQELPTSTSSPIQQYAQLQKQSYLKKQSLKHFNGVKECIQLSSSFSEKSIPRSNKIQQDREPKNPKLLNEREVQFTSIKKKQKKNLKSCITILD